MELVDVKVERKVNCYERVAMFKDTKTGKVTEMPFGSLVLTPPNKKRQMYENNDLADENV